MPAREIYVDISLPEIPDSEFFAHEVTRTSESHLSVIPDAEIKPGDIITIHRQLYTQGHLEEIYQYEKEAKTVCDVVKKQCDFSPKCLGTKALSFFPIVKIIRRYNWRQYPLLDIIGGLSAAFIHLPQGLGYGILASLKPVYGLYTSFFPVVVYLIFGTSPHLSLGTNAVIAMLSGSLLDRSSQEFISSRGVNVTVTEAEIMTYKVGIITAACFICGLILLGMGILKLGFITNYLSKSFIGGFTFAAAVHIATSQIVKILHLAIPNPAGAGKVVITYINIFKNITKSVPGDIIVGVICFAILLGVRIGINERFKDKLKIPIPIELITVIVSTIISHFADLKGKFGIAIVGNVPVGLPAPSFPPVEYLSKVATDAFIMAILAFALTIALAKICAQIHTYEVDDNQELVAYGLCNIVGTFFQNFPSSAAPPRTMLLSSMGTKSTLNNVSTAIFLLLVLLVIGKLFESLPIAMLAAMIIVAMKDLLVQIQTLPTLWRVNKPDFFIWVLTALVSILGDLDLGLLAGVGFSLLTVLLVGQLATGTLLGKSEFEDVIMATDHKGIHPIPGVRIFKFESQLYFASVDRFKKRLFALVYDPARYLRKKPQVKVISDGVIKKGAASNSVPNGTANQDVPNGTAHLDVLNGTTHLVVPNGAASNGVHNAAFDLNYDVIRNPDPRTRALCISPGSSVAEGSYKKVLGEISHEALQANNMAKDLPRLSQVNDIAAQRETHEIEHLLLDCSAMTYIDTAGIDVLQLVSGQFRKAGTEVFLVAVPLKSLATLKRSGFVEKFGKNKIFYTLFDALCQASQENAHVSKL